MNADRWRDVNALFHAALELEGDAREALLQRTAETDRALSDEVRSLLARHKPAEDFLDKPAWAVASDLILEPDGPDQSLAGKQIGSYRIIEQVGRGGMGVVYAAHDERLGRTVALKALPPEYTSDRRYRERLAREARAAASFTHESIATIYALEEIDGELFIVSEFVEGETLRDELARGPTPADRLMSTLIEIASGLSAAHARNIIHRDLKPENVLRRTDGHIKILDFGLARVDDPQVPTVTRLTEPGTTPGTPGYMAPEQLNGGELDARTDLFAFGVVAWELATGEHPFGSNPAVMLAAHDGGPAADALPAAPHARARFDHPTMPARVAVGQIRVGRRAARRSAPRDTVRSSARRGCRPHRAARGGRPVVVAVPPGDDDGGRSLDADPRRTGEGLVGNRRLARGCFSPRLPWRPLP